MMRDGPSEAAYRSSFQTAFKLLWLRAVVVSIKGKGTIKCQVSNRNTNESESPVRRRKDKMMSKPEFNSIAGKKQGGILYSDGYYSEQGCCISCMTTF
jgi:hypothetical protein